MQALQEVVIGQAQTIAAESPVRKFCEALNSLLERRKVYLAPRTKSVVYTPPPHADLIGWSDPDDEALYLDDGACLEHVRAYWASLGENFDTTTDALRRQISQIRRACWPRKVPGRHIQVSKWIAGKTRRALAIDKQAVTRLYGVSLTKRTGRYRGNQRCDVKNTHAREASCGEVVRSLLGTRKLPPYIGLIVIILNIPLSMGVSKTSPQTSPHPHHFLTTWPKTSPHFGLVVRSVVRSHHPHILGIRLIFWVFPPDMPQDYTNLTTSPLK